MELLAPAGSFRQALISIDSGCDALYGGLRAWSARSRATNLSVEEYCELIDICNKKGIKFYLTLNTLMSDQELEDIKSFFERADIPYPHGVLVGDIGLLNLLKTYFPSITVHASTQFGAYCLQDVLYFESLGIKRVVLARELTIKEIESIKKNCNTEVEVFVYGNQCVIFSGNCLWGGLAHSGSGHKGCCIGACNDIFENEDGRIGDFFWVNNIGLYNWVDKLDAIGVDSIKIEGRVRPDKEIKDVVSKFRSAMEGKVIENDYDYDGYLGGEIPPKGIVSDFNPENTHRVIEDVDFTEEDYLLDNKGDRPIFVKGDDTNSKDYIYTIFKKDWKRNSNNIRIRFGFETQKGNHEVISIEYVRVNGTKIFYDFEKEHICGEKKEIVLKDLVNIFDKRIKANIYECKTKIPALSKVVIDTLKMDSIIEKINNDIDEAKPVDLSTEGIIPAKKNEDFLIINDIKDLESYINSGYLNYIYIIRTRDELKKCIQIEDQNNNIKVFYQLPYLDFNNIQEEVYSLLYGRRVVITRISQLAYKEKYKFKQMIGDYMLNVWNSKSALWLKNQGIFAIIAHPEISMDRIKEISEKSGIETIIFAVSKIPYGYTRICFRKIGLCERKCKEGNTRLYNTYKGYNVDLVCDNEFGYRTVFNQDYYVTTSIKVQCKKAFGMIGLSDKEKLDVLNADLREFADKERIYTDGFYQI